MTAEKLPLAIEIEINSHCNLTCSYCPNSSAERVEKGLMSEETFSKLIIQLKSVNYSGRISFHFYNEPTLSPNFVNFLKITRLNLPSSFIDIFTNGILLNLEKIKEYIALGVNKFNITEQIKSDLSSLREEIKLCTDREITSRIFLQNYRSMELTNRGGALKIKNKHTPPLSIPCMIPYCALVVTISGNVVLCYEDYFQKHIMGNILENHILDIWNSEKYYNIRQSLKKGLRSEFPVCKTCNNSWILS